MDEDGKFAVTAFHLNDDAYEQLDEATQRPEVCPRDYDAEEKARVGK